MLNQLRPALVLLIALTAITGLAYPLAMTGIAGAIFPAKAAGSLIERDGKVVGSSLIGQSFTSEPDTSTVAPRPRAPPIRPTPPRPSRRPTTPRTRRAPTSGRRAPPWPSGSRATSTALKAENPGKPVPVDLVTTSGSGLDPDISPDAALFQVPRVAKARSLPEDRVRSLVEAQVQGRLLGILGEPRVNVLALNLALDGSGSK